MSAAVRFDPTLEANRVDDLRRRLTRACEEAKARPEPVAPFESDKERFGLTHARYRHLLFSWNDFLSEDRKSVIDSRLGPDHDSWPAFEKKLASFQHYRIEIEDVKLHYIEEKASRSVSSNRPVIPLLLLHGWPSSVHDFFETIKPLAHPGESAPDRTPAFDVVVPSQTGYLWSSSPTVDGFGRGKHSGPQGDFLLVDEARIVHKLMLSLGYQRYAIQAGDWSSTLARQMARLYPSNVAAVHLNFCPAPPPLLEPLLISWMSKLVPSPVRSIACALTPSFVSQTLNTIQTYPRWKSRLSYTQNPTVWTLLGYIFLGLPAPLGELDRAKVLKTNNFLTTGCGYSAMQGTRPSTLGLVLQSDPGALLAWIGEKMLEWTDEDPTDADICALLTLWWCTDTMPRSIYNYRNRPPTGVEAAAGDRALYIKQPVGFSDFPQEIAPAPLSWMKKTANIRWYRYHTSGGHFISLERPVEFVDDVRDCFEAIWTA